VVAKAKGVKGAAAQEEAPAAGAAKGAEERDRKIIRTGEVQLIVESLDQAEQKLRQLVAEHKGDVDSFQTQETPGTPREGRWTVRIPSDHFDAFMDAVGGLGEVRSRSSNSEDVSDRYYDMEAHLKNDETEEQSLRQLLEKTAGKVEDILTVRKALTDVRGRIEVQKAQLQRWDKDVRRSTVTVRLFDRKDYRPPIVPDFGTSVGRTFQGSVEALVSFGKMLVLGVVAVAPWLAVLAVIGFPVLWWRRRARSFSRRTPTAG
jgi:hypothetical protein